MTESYPVTFDLARPQKFQRVNVGLRVAIIAILAILVGSIGWVLGLVYLIIPVLAAIFVARREPDRFLAEDGPRLIGWLRWLLALDAYLRLLTDRFPTEKPEEIVRFEVQTGGSPTVGSALLRLVFSIPSAFVLAVFGLITVITWIAAAVTILLREDYPDALYNFHRAYVRWAARLLAYRASLIEQYPPFAIDTGPEQAPAGA